MSTKQKCCCKVFDKLSNKKGRVCKANVWKEFGGKKYCYSHAKKILDESAIILQKHQRANHCRKIINNIYKKLPSDTQRIIDKYINKEIYIKRQNNIIIKIMHKRFFDIEKKIFKIDSINHIDFINNPTTDIKITELYYKISKEIISLLTLIINNWDNIHLLNSYQIHGPNSTQMQDFLVKFFLLAKNGIWGTTIWNGKSLEYLTDYLSYICDISLVHQEKNFEFAHIYFTKLSDYWNLFVNTFDYQRTSMYGYRLEFL